MISRTALFLSAAVSLTASCTSEPGRITLSDSGMDSGSVTNGCALTANTTASGVESPNGCAVLTRDTSACAAARSAAGLTGLWLKFSCRVALSVTNVGGVDVVQATSDGRPDYLSNYYASTDPCWESYTDAIQNPNSIAVKSYIVNFRTLPNTTATSMQGIGVIGMTVSGVPMYANFAAPGDDIYQESMTFDRCAGHPQMSGAYHSHTEPFSISYDDANLIGVMRDGYAIYGRRDSNGTYPTLDVYGGHTAVTADSPSVAVYHYHVSEQTSTSPGTSGMKAWFLAGSSIQWRGAPATCTACN
jgi:hypothetical protein